MATVKCALGKRGRPSHEWNDGKKDRIYCCGYIDQRTDSPLPECVACPDYVDKAQGDLEAFYKERLDMAISLRAQKEDNVTVTLPIGDVNLRSIVLRKLRGVEYQYTQMHSLTTENVADTICQGIERCLIQQQPSDPLTGWISVKERLPDTCVCVLVHYDDGNMLVDAVGSDGEWMDEDYSCGNITHWMPLPDPPEEGTT